MRNPPPAELETEVLTEPVSARLLARASELDAARGAGVSVLELRAAAVEAGISARAFDEALAELRAAGQGGVPQVSRPPRRPQRAWSLSALIAILLAVAALVASRAIAPVGSATQAAVPTVEKAFLLRCLSPGEAAELVRPLLRLRTNSVVYSATQANRVLSIRATPEQLQQVQSLLDQYEGAESPVCAPKPVPGARP